MRRLVRRVLAGASRRTPLFRGKMRVLRAVDRWLAPPTVDELTSSSGVVFAVSGTDIIEFQLRYQGSYGAAVANALAQVIPDGDVVYWDIGANIGSVVLPTLKRFPRLEAFAFEPSPHVLDRLLRNASLNPELSSRLTVLGLALSDRVGPTEFFPSNEPQNSGVGGLARSANRSARALLVWSARGDDLIVTGAAPAPSVIKIDVEGFEIEVLRGLHDTLKRTAPMAILFEHSPYRLREREIAVRTVPDFLEGLGFRISTLDHDGRVRPLEEGDLALEIDFLATKSVA